MPEFLTLILVLLVAAIVLVPLFARLGMGSILGYLVAGVLIGPYVFGWVRDVEAIQHTSEIGVVLFLFLIGLELRPQRLWEMRQGIFVIGGLQLLLVTSVVAVVLHLTSDGTWLSHAVIGVACAMSSTAIALQTYRERNWLNTSGGQAGLSVSLFQDISVIPILSLLPLWAATKIPAVTSTGANGYLHWLLPISAILGVLIAGRTVVRPVLRVVAGIQVREVFTALSLFLVLGVSALMVSVELTMSLGAFLAGVILSDSEYRHAVETDIEPFKGLLLGLFFMAVGMSIDLPALAKTPLSVGLAVVLVMSWKTLVHWLLARYFELPKVQRSFFALSIASIGEFSFVLLALGGTLGILAPEQTGFWMGATAVSMLVTPLLFRLHDKWKEKTADSKPPADEITSHEHPVLIAGFGRFGQIIGRMLFAQRIPCTVLDYEPSQIELLRRFGFKVYYGDATRLDLLQSAGIEKARAVVVAIDDVEQNLKLVDLVQQHFPHLKIFARARNVQHVYELMDRKVHVWERETFESSLRLGTSLLHFLGHSAHDAWRMAQKFRAHNIGMIEELHPERKNQQALTTRAQVARQQLEDMMVQDAKLRDSSRDGWE